MRGLSKFLASVKVDPSIPQEPVGEAAVRAVEAAQEARTLEHLLACGVPAEVARRVADGLDDGDLFPSVRETRAWWKNGGLHLVLLGAVGCGKTSTAAAVLKLVRKDLWFHDGAGAVQLAWQYDPRAMFAEAGALRAFPPWTPEGSALWLRSHAAPVLVVDELPREPNARFVEDLDALIVHRHSAGQRTVLTGNMREGEFQRWYRGRIWSRVGERGVVVNCGNEDRRMRR